MESVAEPAPALASTTSVPASWMRFVIGSISASSKDTEGVTCTQHRRSGSMRFSLRPEPLRPLTLQARAAGQVRKHNSQAVPETAVAGWWRRRGRR